MSLSETLKEIQEKLAKKDKARQEIQAAMRKATRLSKQAIFLVHRAEIEKARGMLGEAGKALCKLDELSEGHTDLLYMGTVDAALQEYTEAYVFLSLVENRRFVSFKEINVPMTSYVLGLADVIGEFRRRALDFIRKSEHGKAEECLELMETIYAELVNLDEIQYLIPGLRRKCDIARGVIEATRGDVTNEARRSLLENSINELKRKIEAKEKQ